MKVAIIKQTETAYLVQWLQSGEPHQEWFTTAGAALAKAAKLLAGEAA